jgi:hypothetical protein
MQSRHIFSALLVIASLSGAILFCAKHSPTSVVEPDFTGKISGYVYAKSGKPLSGVFVASDADSAIPDAAKSEFLARDIHEFC